MAVKEERANALRSEVYTLLGELLREPTKPLFEALVSGDGADALADAFESLSLTAAPFFFAGAVEGVASPPRSLEELKQAYWDAFANPLSDRVTPVESVYRPWSEASTTDAGMGGARGYLLSDRALHLLELYRLTGVAVPAGFEAMPDHLALELEFMALLCRRGHPAEQARFLEDHLSWLDDLAQDARRREIPVFYAAVLELAASLVRWDAAHLHQAREGG